MSHRTSLLSGPTFSPELDPSFSPAAVAHRTLEEKAKSGGKALPVELVLERPNGMTSRFETTLWAPGSAKSTDNFYFLERSLKALLWSRGAARVYCTAPEKLCKQLSEYYRADPAGQWDADMMGRRIFEEPLRVIHCSSTDLPPENDHSTSLGRHLAGCRIGFDLGGSDLKIASLVEGKTVFSEEIVWDPIPQKDPQWHYEHIMRALKIAGSKMPRVDAIGGSAAGVYVDNQVKVASLFRSIPEELFEKRVRGMFLEMQRAWGDIPFVVVNDGEVTALAGSMNLEQNAVLGIAMGTNQAAGFVTPSGQITPWLNELAFVPVDYRKNAPADEWSGDLGCGVQYFSQQAVARLIPEAGIEVAPEMPFPEQLLEVQALMAANDPRAASIYRTLGVYLGYALAHYATFYEFKHLLLLGRVTTGSGANLMTQKAEEVIKTDFPELADQITIHLPSEKEKRHGQAMAAASLPTISH
jgi:predicted NBD/HSP70 family sugar kinase